MTSDAHPGALDAGLDTALIFVDMDPSNTFKSYSDKVHIIISCFFYLFFSLTNVLPFSFTQICASIIDKAFGSRPVTQAKGKALILKMMEVDEPSTLTAVLITKLRLKTSNSLPNNR